MSEAPLKATLKAGTGYDAPWLTVDGTDPDDLKNKLAYIAENGVLQALVDAASQLHAVNNVQTVTAQPQQAAPQAAPVQQQGGWGQQPQAQQAPQQQYQQPAQQQNRGGGSRFGGQPHPTGESCHCGKVLEAGVTRTGKNQWKCPDYRYNAGNPNDHRLEWA